LAIGFAESDSIASHLPHGSWFVAFFVVAGFAFIVLLGFSDASARERDPVVRAFIRLFAVIRSKTTRS
jgi:hypothetical protein